MNDLTCGAEAAIRSVLGRVSRAQDELDFEGYRACLTDKVFLEKAVLVPNWTPGLIESERLVSFTLEGLAKYDATHHMVFNHIIEAEGGNARCLADVNTMHMLHEDGATRWCLVGGRYAMSLTLQARGWLISERSMMERYRIGDETVLEAAKGPPRREINFGAAAR